LCSEVRTGLSQRTEPLSLSTYQEPTDSLAPFREPAGAENPKQRASRERRTNPAVITSIRSAKPKRTAKARNTPSSSYEAMWHRAREMPPRGLTLQQPAADRVQHQTVQTPVSSRPEAKPPGTSPAGRRRPAASRGRAFESTHPPTGTARACRPRKGHAVHSTAHWWQCHAAMVVSALRPGGPAHRQTRALRLVACLLRDRAELPEAAPRCQIITPQSW